MPWPARDPGFSSNHAAHLVLAQRVQLTAAFLAAHPADIGHERTFADLLFYHPVAAKQQPRRDGAQWRLCRLVSRYS